MNRIQNIRKESGFELTDRIFVKLLENERLRPSIDSFKDYICAEILADDLTWEPGLEQGQELDINGNTLKINVLKRG
ncbi:MAG: DUF5915 domain-containing protein [Sediminibacterium sp.]|nr:DUF5915 domain-containing protein [Sediminibacterium sp.]